MASVPWPRKIASGDGLAERGYPGERAWNLEEALSLGKYLAKFFCRKDLAKCLRRKVLAWSFYFSGSNLARSFRGSTYLGPSLAFQNGPVARGPGRGRISSRARLTEGG